MNYCKCNCGTQVKKEWATGHHRKGQTFLLSEEAKAKIRAAKLGTKNPRFGKPGTRLGATHTATARRKIRDARSRQVITLEHRAKISRGLFRAWEQGKGAFVRESWHLWKGGITPINKQLRRTPEYKEWRKAVFARDNYSCQECGIRGGEIQADHIKPFALHPELRTELSNGRTLCRPCHLNTPTFGLRYDLYQQASGRS